MLLHNKGAKEKLMSVFKAKKDGEKTDFWGTCLK